MSDFEFDFVVIGGGSGGVRAARVAGQLGARVALIESERLGGTCVNAGCIPKKLLFYAAEIAHALEDASGYGWEAAHASLRWERLIANKDVEIARLNAVYARLLENAGVELVSGRATLVGAHAVRVNERVLRARHILIATGGKPQRLDIPGNEHAIVSDDAFQLPQLPRRVLLVGAGYIALEFAGIFHALACEVQIVHHGEQILRGFDDDVRQHLGAELRKQGIAIRCSTALRAIERTADGLRVQLSDGTSEPCDTVMFAVGRAPNTSELGLAQVGVRCDAQGAIAVDAQGRTSLPHVFAVGDCTGGAALTPIAIAQGHALARMLFGNFTRTVDLRFVPTAVFSQPAVATVGLTEQVAREQQHEVICYRSEFTPLKHQLTGRKRRNLVKVVVDADSERVLGFHMVGADAPEIIQGFAAALSLGITKPQLDAVIALHPTSAEEFVLLS